MRGVFEDDEEDLERGRSVRDTELTLGSGMLLTLFFGLVVVCGLCFGLGYALGHHASLPQQASAGSQPTNAATSSIPKPSAVAQPPASAGAAPNASDQPAAAGSVPPGTTAVAVPMNSAQPAAGASTPAAAPAGQPQVRPAFPPMTNTPAPMTAPQAGAAVPAMRAMGGQAQGNFWVQIAAVSHVEDAEVLTNALRRRGYTVTPRREPADNLIHVRIGPFVTQAEASNWRMKLLNDGYNAIIQP